jgi:hypothetical protein
MTSRFALMGTALALSACSSAVTPGKMAQIKPEMTPDQVQVLLGRPASIDQSQPDDGSISGEVDYYTAPDGEGRVVIVNHTVFHAEFVPGAKP